MGDSEDEELRRAIALSLQPQESSRTKRDDKQPSKEVIDLTSDLDDDTTPPPKKRGISKAAASPSVKGQEDSKIPIWNSYDSKGTGKGVSQSVQQSS